MNAEKVSEHIVNWLKNYAIDAKVNGFVIGISGGIDSAVTSVLCAKTGFKTVCVEMPIHQAESQVNRALEHINHLKDTFSNVSSVKIDLTSTFEDFKKQTPSIENSSTLDLALANTRARLRMTSLYYLAGLDGLLVAGTGNKVEDFGVGFYTKYGDGGVDVSPIADLLKSEVYELATCLRITKSIQNAQPTDGLFGDSRTDEDQIGASYDELEWAMHMLENGKFTLDFTGRKLEVFKIYTRLNTINQHKMLPVPICKISDDLK
ncbi:NH(3)-dependent NAD(+) synthetase [Polaribacter huanghezhanensis]|uniref:NAD(+) synthase n=1 Tax=Polaribacter huanghezhanensis TaxID=1354726 RepID=UPI002649E4BB|nr:NAD(+) synthase [Polaribacter huanghezhanensis]WKD85023.1 NH(3)-dependent NAD(+) synthetase [Polaribacter huanghezhanensis]